MPVKSIGLFSGGLDSCIAVRTIQLQGLEVIGVAYDLGLNLSSKREDRLQDLARKLGISLRTIDISSKIIERIISPRWFYGTAVNPCIDCKLVMLLEAAKLMKEENAEFVFTGEVLGQRPMTQNLRIMKLLESESGLSGRLLRPLSALLLEPTIPEKENIVKRDQLFGIQGRSRKEQFKLAHEWHLEGFDSPAGGCLLTDREYGGKVQDLLIHIKNNHLIAEDFQALNLGRHFRITEDVKLIVGRNDYENNQLENYAKDKIKICLKDIPGPLALISGEPTELDLKIAASIVIRYSKARGYESVVVEYKQNDTISCIEAQSITDKDLDNYRIKFDRSKLESMRREKKREKAKTV